MVTKLNYNQHVVLMYYKLIYLCKYVFNLPKAKKVIIICLSAKLVNKKSADSSILVDKFGEYQSYYMQIVFEKIFTYFS